MKPKTKFFVAMMACLFFLVLSRANVQAETSAFGFIATDTTWTAADSPYVVDTAGVMVIAGARLTLEPGVVVKFRPGTQLINHTGHVSGPGVIIAQGTATEPIIFTSYYDDSVGGDTNADGNATSPNFADWARVQSGSDSDVFEYAEFRYGNKCLQTAFSSPTIKNNLFTNCNIGVDMVFPTATAEIYGNTFLENYTGISFLAGVGMSFQNNNFLDNISYAASNSSSDSATATGNWWGHTGGACLPSEQPTCVGKGGKITTGFIIESSLIAEYTGDVEPVLAEGSPAPIADPFGGQSTASPSAVTYKPQIVKFTATTQAFKEGEGDITLSWQTANAEFVRIEPGDKVEKNGSMKVSPDESTEYQLIALGPGGEVKQNLRIEKLPRDPVIIIPGILGSARGWRGALVLDPILHTYDGLWEGMKSVGYKEGVDLFAFPYDWRLDNQLTATYLAQKIEEVRQICHCPKVDLVAHSMGGLVARYYIQSINDQSVDQIIFLGTPHLGSPKAYLAWEAGEMGNEIPDNILEKLFQIEALSKGYISVVNYIHEHVLSIKQLLPVFSYLSDYNTNHLYRYSECAAGSVPCNDFLDTLNQQDIKDIPGIRSYAIVNDAINTFRTFLLDKKDNKWAHGKPYNYPANDGVIYGPGDATVPLDSGRAGVHEVITVNAEHSSLPYQAQSEVTKILIGKEISVFGKTKPIKKVLLVGIKSPADIILTTPAGKKYGSGFGDDETAFYAGQDDPEYLVISDPVHGQYLLQVIGTGQGHFEIEASLLAGDVEESQSFAGQITLDQKYEFDLAISDAESSLTLENKDITAPETKLLLTGQKKGVNEYYLGSFGTLEATDEQGTVGHTEYSLDLGQTWIQYQEQILFPQAGEYDLLYRSEDIFGNLEYARYNKFRIIEPLVANRSDHVSKEKVSLEANRIATTTEEIISQIPTETVTSSQVLGAIMEVDHYSTYLWKLLYWFLGIASLIISIYFLKKKVIK